MGEVVEEKMSPATQTSTRTDQIPAAIAAPPFQLHSPSLPQSPFLDSPSLPQSPFLDIASKTPKSPLISRLMNSPLASPMKKAILSMRSHLEEVGHLTKLDPQDAWLPITESRKGNALYAAFHTLSSGIGVQALVLPLAFTTLGWSWGIMCLLLVFVWQLYTLWLLIQLHETESGTRYSRYLRLSMAAFGEKQGKLMALFPIMYLSGGTCVALIMIGGRTLKIFFDSVCGSTCNLSTFTTIEWYVVFTCCALVLSQLPNLNSIAGVSFVGAVTAVSYCTMIWVMSVIKDRPVGVDYEPIMPKSKVDGFCNILNALGIIAFAFRGHNLVLEIQGTMPSTIQNPSRVPMWKGVKLAYLIISLCLFPLAIAGYWAYGNSIPSNGGMFKALYKYHQHDTSKPLLGLITLLIMINSLTSFQIYAMPVFDNLELRYTSNVNKPCPQWLRTGFRIFFCCLAFFISVALPVLKDLAGLIGGAVLPITLAYPCFMWIFIKKPRRNNAVWLLNWALGWLGMVLSVLVVIGAVWSIVSKGLEAHFFNPQ